MSGAGRRRLALGAIGCAIVALAACRPVDSAGQAEPPPAPVTATGEAAILARSTALLAAIRDRDVGVIAEFFHPTKGVRLSPYAFVGMTDDQVLTADQFVEAWHDPSPRLWGVEDGTGDPLMMSCADYIERFVYDVDFMQAEQIAVDGVIGRGNTINNALEAYPEATLVEYHVPGVDPQYEGLDWRSLRLAFERFEGDWYLVGIIHDQWTT